MKNLMYIIGFIAGYFVTANFGFTGLLVLGAVIIIATPINKDLT